MASSNVELLRSAFSVKGRMGRKTYVLAHTVFFLAIVAFVVLEFLMLGFPAFFSALTVAAYCIVNITMGIQRLHDLGRSGWWFLLSLIPGLSLILCLVLIFAPGTEGENRYGPSA